MKQPKYYNRCKYLKNNRRIYNKLNESGTRKKGNIMKNLTYFKHFNIQKFAF